MGLGLLSPARRPGLYGTGDYSPRPKAGTETAVLSQRLGLYGTGDCSPQPKVGTGTEALSTRSGPQSAVRDCMWLGTLTSLIGCHYAFDVMKWLVVGVHPHSSHIHKVFEAI